MNKTDPKTKWKVINGDCLSEMKKMRGGGA